MGQTPLIPERLRQLFDAVCDEVATAEQLEELQRLLRTDEQARQYYVDYCRLIVDLFFDANEQQMMADAVKAIETTAIETTPVFGTNATVRPKNPPAEPPAVPAAGGPTKSPVLGFLGGAMDYVNHSRTMMFSLIALALSGWFIVQIGSLMFGRSRPGGGQVAGRPVDSNSPDVSHRPGGSFANSASPRPSDSVAFLTTIVDCHWRVVPPAAPPASAPAPGDADTVLYNGEPFHVGSALSAGRQLDLVRGLAEITFRSGARIVLNGPAHLTVGSPMGGKLQIGKLTARVPHDAHGFTVNTPAGEVVDLGTEFGVAVAADHTMAVEVFVGEVAVDASPDGQAPGSPSETPSPPLKLSAGHAVRVAPGQPVVSIPLDPKRFVRGLGPREDSHVAQAAYLDYVRSLKPVVWFRMEGQDTDRVLHDEMGGADAKLNWDGPGNPFVEGRLGKGLWLRGSQLKDGAIVPSYPQAEHGKLSVSAWVYAESYRPFAVIACNWASASGQFYMGLQGKGGNGAALFTQFTQQDGNSVKLPEANSHPFPLNEWQHVALTTDGATLRLYRQGREVATTRHDGLQYPARPKMLGIGVKPNDAGSAAHATDPDFWDGKLDEIALFNDVLSADEIRKLAAAPPQ